MTKLDAFAKKHELEGELRVLFELSLVPLFSEYIMQQFVSYFGSEADLNWFADYASDPQAMQQKMENIRAELERVSGKSIQAHYEDFLDIALYNAEKSVRNIKLIYNKAVEQSATKEEVPQKFTELVEAKLRLLDQQQI